MRTDTRNFWRSLQTGIEVAVASTHAEKLLGVREGFLRYFMNQLQRQLAVVVVPQEERDSKLGLTLTDADTLALAFARARALKEELDGHYHFYVCTEGGLHSVEVGNELHYFVHNWTAVISDQGEAWGGSGSVQLPKRLVQGLENEEIPFAVPGTRRGGGMLSSLTGGMETRRTAVAASTLNALSTLYYGVLDARLEPQRGS